nr:transposase (putative), gypsy type [Tanacetum cinerariifolium]
MASLADKAILSGAENRPPMLEKDMYDSWRSRMEIGRATNIILQALPPEIYALVSTHKVAKYLWERIQMLMQGTSLTKQEKECKLYDAFDKFAYQKGETLCNFYLRFSLLLNEINMYNMKLEQFQVNTKFLNTLPPEWSKFVTDVKLFHIPEDVHSQLPSPNQTTHEMSVEKIGVYTRFFEYDNFRLPLSTFLVNVLRHFRINLSQLSVIAAAKVSHFEILCRVHNIEPTVGLFRCFYVNSKNKGWMSFSKRSDNDVVCYTKPIDSLKHWNDHFFWVDSFACPASFPWHTEKNVSRDPFPKSTVFNADDYAILVAHPAPFWKFPEPFLCLVGMNCYYTLDEDTYPNFLHDDGTGGCLSLYDVAVVTAERPRRQRIKRPAITDASGSSHSPKKLRGVTELLVGYYYGKCRILEIKTQTDD